MFRKLATYVLAVTAALLLTSRPAAAATATGVLTVNAVVANYCTIPDATLDFGLYDPGAAGADLANVVVNVQCTPGTSFHLYMDGVAGTRTLTSGTNTLDYVLYADPAAPATPWPVTLAGSPLYGPAPAGPGMGTVPVTVYGSITASQFVQGGSYTEDRKSVV